MTGGRPTMKFANLFFSKILILFVSVFTVAPKALAQYRGYYDGWGMGPGMMGWGGGGWFGPFFMIFFWVLIIVLIIFLIRWLIYSSHHKIQPPSGENSALEILKKRYARGEIDKEEFETKKKDLS
jgi:putative membrane protein